MIETEKLIEIAKEAAFEAGEIQMANFGRPKEISHKQCEFDLVTNVDKMSEKKILEIIKSNFSDHAFLAEQGGVTGNNNSDYTWIIDPLDGTTNYAHNFPHFAVSIGLFYKNQPFLGVVYDVFKNEMFWAVKDSGAFLNDEPIRVSEINELKRSLLATGFPANKLAVEKNIEYFRSFLPRVQAIRRPGSAALDICYTACGRLDGFWEMALSPWDVAAGICIVQEAGGMVSNFYSDDFDINVKNIIASNGKIHQQIKDVIASYDSKTES